MQADTPEAEPKDTDVKVIARVTRQEVGKWL